MLWVLLYFAFTSELTDEGFSEWASAYLDDDLETGPAFISRSYAIFAMTCTLQAGLASVTVGWYWRGTRLRGFPRRRCLACRHDDLGRVHQRSSDDRPHLRHHIAQGCPLRRGYSQFPRPSAGAHQSGQSIRAVRSSASGT